MSATAFDQARCDLEAELIRSYGSLEAAHAAALARCAEQTQARTAPPAPRRPCIARRRDVGAAPTHDHRYARLSAALYSDIRLNDSSRRVVGYVVWMARGRPAVDLWVEQIADALGVSVRTAQRAQALAARHGYLGVERRRTGRLNQANRYTPLGLCFPVARPKPLGPPVPDSAVLSGDNFVTPRGRELNTPPLPPLLRPR